MMDKKFISDSSQWGVKMREIYNVTSQNCRWGFSMVSNTIGTWYDLLDHPSVITHLGSVEGKEVYQVEVIDNPKTYTFMTEYEAEVVSGATLVECINLQGGNFVSLIQLGETAIVRVYGYKRRSNQVLMFHEGRESELASSVLLAMGMIESEREIKEISPLPPFNPVFADLLERMGVTK